MAQSSLKILIHRNAGGLEMNVTFQRFPLMPAENNIFHHTGNPDLSTFTCDVSALEPEGFVECNITDIVNTNIRGEETVDMPHGSLTSSDTKNLQLLRPRTFSRNEMPAKAKLLPFGISSWGFSITTGLSAQRTRIIQIAKSDIPAHLSGHAPSRV